MYYANYDENTGEILGFYSDEIHTEIPEPKIELTEEEWQQAITGSYKVVNGRLEHYVPSALPFTKEDKIVLEQRICKNKIDELSDRYIIAVFNNDMERMSEIRDEYNSILNDFNSKITNIEIGIDITHSTPTVEYCPLCGSVLNSDGTCPRCKWRKLS